MTVDQIGTTLDIGAGTITGSYIVESREEGDKDVTMEDIDDQNGELFTRLVFKKLPKETFNLICILGALPEDDFKKGEIAAHVDFTAQFVEDARFSKSKGPRRVAVTFIDLGIT